MFGTKVTKRDLDLLLIEGVYEYDDDEFGMTNHTSNALKALADVCRTNNISVRVIVERKPTLRNIFVDCDYEEARIYLDYEKYEKYLLPLIGDTQQPTILLTGGQLNVAEQFVPVSNEYSILDKCVGERATDIYKFLGHKGKLPRVYIDPKSAVPSNEFNNFLYYVVGIFEGPDIVYPPSITKKVPRQIGNLSL